MISHNNRFQVSRGRLEDWVYRPQGAEAAEARSQLCFRGSLHALCLVTMTLYQPTFVMYITCRSLKDPVSELLLI